MTDETKVGIAVCSHDVRLKIYCILLAGNDSQLWSPKDLAEELEIPVHKAAYHVRKLDDYGVIQLVKKCPVRGAVQHFYGLNRHLAEAPVVQDLVAAATQSHKRSRA
jgi:predicted ArsR family transcriptional regulator